MSRGEDITHLSSKSEQKVTNSLLWICPAGGVCLSAYRELTRAAGLRIATIAALTGGFSVMTAVSANV
jgi:hypothetical protein